MREDVAMSAGALRLVVTAERLFAERGIDGVSLRQIATEAGSANNSAVHYHFGSKDGLIAAIFRHRLPRLVSERRLLAAQCDPDDLRARFEAHYLPVLNLAEASDNHYVSFVEQLQRYAMASPSAMAALVDLPEEGRCSHEEFVRDLDALLPHLDERLRALRIAEAEVLCIHAAADRDRAVSSGAALVPFDVYVSSLFDGLTAFLSTEPSTATRRRLRSADAVPHANVRLL